jgi:hypothetical protein
MSERAIVATASPWRREISASTDGSSHSRLDRPDPPFAGPSRLRAPDEARDDGLPLALSVDVLLDLDRVHLGLTHLSIEEFDDAAQLRRDLVGDEDKSDPIGGEIRSDHVPVTVRVGHAARGFQFGRTTNVPPLALGLEPRLQGFDLPNAIAFAA